MSEQRRSYVYRPTGNENCEGYCPFIGDDCVTTEWVNETEDHRRWKHERRCVFYAGADGETCYILLLARGFSSIAKTVETEDVCGFGDAQIQGVIPVAIVKDRTEARQGWCSCGAEVDRYEGNVDGSSVYCEKCSEKRRQKRSSTSSSNGQGDSNGRSGQSGPVGPS